MGASWGVNGSCGHRMPETSLESAAGKYDSPRSCGIGIFNPRKDHCHLNPQKTGVAVYIIESVYMSLCVCNFPFYCVGAVACKWASLQC